MSKATPIVAKRNDPAALEPYSKSRSTQAENQDPNFKYHWFRPDQLEAKCREHEIGNARTGYLMVAGWQVVSKAEGIETGPGPAAGSNNTDSTVSKGDLVLCKLPNEEHAKYAVIDKKNDQLVSKRFEGERHEFGMQTSFRSKVVGGASALDASTSDILGAS
jgi:hypothetical protein